MFSSFISGVYGIVLLSDSERITEYLDFSKTGFSRLAIVEAKISDHDERIGVGCNVGIHVLQKRNILSLVNKQ